MRIINKPSEVVPDIDPPKKPKVIKDVKSKFTEHWYRVAILRFADSKKLYTCVIDKPHHQLDIETRINFVRWETPVTVTIKDEA